MDTKTKFYQKNWFIYLMLLLFPPVGIILLWIFNQKSSKFKIIISAISSIWFIMILISGKTFSSIPTMFIAIGLLVVLIWAFETNKKMPFKKTTYGEYQRPEDGFPDNMNYKLYNCKGLYQQTNRRRTIQIEAFSDEDVEQELEKKGYVKPYEIERIPFPQATDAQIQALNNINYTLICKYDASALLSKKFDYDSTPNPDLLVYATEMKIKLSYYIGKNALYDLIFANLEPRDKIAFFVFCVYRFTTDDRHGNLNTSRHKNLFYQFADEHISDDQFVKSVNRYNGHQLKFFGTLSLKGTELTGGSTTTVAYKTTIKFLKNHFRLKNINKKSL